ncbi:uncharacterized protein LOC136050189 [Cyrtonyx montezumae]|uniref:uncharacterized protein LOC136050189 n=1 Tax=Cyrtonyx montezumae TaxID=9017 RepID=UPI0032DBC2CE
MSRDLSPRRKLGPAIFHKTESQDRLIEELQDRLGVAKQEQEEPKSQDDWLTEGVVITARPQGEEQNGGQQVEKVVFPPESPHPRRRTVSVSASPPLQPSTEAMKTVPANALPSRVPLLPPPAQPSHVLATSAPCPVSSCSFRLAPQPLFQWEGSDADYHELSVVGTPPSEDPRHSSPQARTPSTKTVVSVGCQTEDEAFFPRMQVTSAPPFIRSANLLAASAPLAPPSPEKAGAPLFPLSMVCFLGVCAGSCCWSSQRGERSCCLVVHGLVLQQLPECWQVLWAEGQFEGPLHYGFGFVWLLC